MGIPTIYSQGTGRLRWLWYAIGLHVLFDFVAVAISTGLPKLAPGLDATATALIVEGWATLFAAFSLWLIFALRDDSTPSAENAASAAVALADDAPNTQPLAG
jgi:hypothetical protein